ncbi:hypothetical protein [Actinomarinicola tropica]|uniref:Uncharacterized protein n=1 Tax=Actinomarinicola tropica TaxID=2789776 RepID=A0A5Q2RL33_9ACTN|nr:hypothetical protein [Actinomarinicola tropica]QGG94767.1 hypothetical protein GH723_06395 [Actinomarinicola tropica]
MHPSERVRFAVETARAVLEDRLDPGDAAAAMALQLDQVVPQLRSDRDSVTRSESESVATTLRLLGEQVNDHGSGLPDPSAHAEIARILGRMAQSLR